MKGTTTIEMNESTMLAAVQMYLDSQLVGKHTVTSIKAKSSSYNCNTFEVTITDEEPAKAA